MTCSSWLSRLPWLRPPGIFGIALFAIMGIAPAAPAQSLAPSSQALRHVDGFTPAPLDSAFGPLDISRPVGITPKRIIRRFAAKETQFKQALESYTYRRSVKFDTLNKDGDVDGEYLQIDDIVFTTAGRKREMVVYAPASTLTRVAMSPADFDDLEHRLPFTLTSEDIGQYRLTYVGRQRIDEVATYVFDVAPKQIDKDRRYFTGRIWVDAHDFQIIVTNGRNIPDDTRPDQEDLSIPFTTYRQQIDGKYWFPVYTRAEGVLHFSNCKQCEPDDVPLREIVDYGDYKRFGSDIRIIYGSLELLDRQSQPSQTASGPQTLNSGGTAGQVSDAIQQGATKE